MSFISLLAVFQDHAGRDLKAMIANTQQSVLSYSGAPREKKLRRRGRARQSKDVENSRLKTPTSYSRTGTVSPSPIMGLENVESSPIRVAIVSTYMEATKSSSRVSSRVSSYSNFYSVK